MAEFQKKENFAIIKIENAEYKVESIAGNRMICAYNDNTPSFLKQIEESKYDSNEVAKFMDFLVGIIDAALGDNACQNIFNGQCSYYDLVDLYVCIRDEVRKFDKLKADEYATL